LPPQLESPPAPDKRAAMSADVPGASIGDRMMMRVPHFATLIWALTLASRLGAAPAPPYLNVLDFGAKPYSKFGDAKLVASMPDSTAAIQKALDAGAGGTVFIPKGVFRVTQPLHMKQGTTLMGAGLGGTVLTTEKPIVALLHLKAIGGPMTVVRDLFFAGPVGGNATADAIFLEHTNGVTIRDCWIGGWVHAIRILGVSDHWIRNVVYEFNREGILISEPALGRFHGNLRLFDVYGYHNWLAGIRVENVRGIQAEGCAACGNDCCLLLKNCADVTISGANANWDASPYSRIGIDLDGCTLVSIRGCTLEGEREAGIRATGCRLLTISDNAISNVRSGPGIALDRCESSAVRGNMISQTAGHGAWLHASRGVILSQNIVEEYGVGAAPQAASAMHGILADASCSGCSVADNVVTPNPHAGSPVATPAP
jgi:hypothetical protein